MVVRLDRELRTLTTGSGHRIALKIRLHFWPEIRSQTHGDESYAKYGKGEYFGIPVSDDLNYYRTQHVGITVIYGNIAIYFCMGPHLSVNGNVREGT